MTMKPAVVRMPTVQIPTLRPSTSTSSHGLGSLVSSSGAWDTQHAVMIEDLVQGVQQCQQAAKRAQDTLRRQRSDDAVVRRTRSPQPIAERKPWGANNTPHHRPATSQPPTEGKPVVSRTSRSSTPDPTGVVGKTTRLSPPTRQQTSASTRPKLSHHTPPTPTPRQSDSPSLSARSNRQTHAAVVPPASGPRPAMLEAMLEETNEHVQRLEREVQTANERAAATDLRCTQLEQQVRLLTEKFAAQQEELNRLRTETTQVPRAVPQTAAPVPVPAAAFHAQPAPIQLHPYPFPVATQRSVQPLPHHVVLAQHQQHVQTQQTSWWIPPTAANVVPEIEGGVEEDEEARSEDVSNDDNHVARKLDLSAESNKSVTRVPPQPPLNLRLA